MEPRKALLLVGSPKPGRSSSLALGEHLIDDLAKRGWSTETITLRRDDAGGAEETAAPRLVAIANCGFPEHDHNDLSLEMCRLFAAQAGFRWSGGLSLGGGGMLDGKPLRERGPFTRSARRALELTAAALDAGHDVPAEAVRLMARPMVSPRVYRWMGNYGWRRAARANGISDKLAERPPQV